MDKLILDGETIENMRDAANWLKKSWHDENLNIYYADDKDCLVIEDFSENEVTFVQTLQEFLLII